MKRIDTQEMIEKSLSQMNEHRVKLLQENEERVKLALIKAPAISKEKVQKYLHLIDKLNYVKSDKTFILLTNSEEVKMAYNKMTNTTTVR